VKVLLILHFKSPCPWTQPLYFINLHQKMLGIKKIPVRHLPMKLGVLLNLHEIIWYNKMLEYERVMKNIGDRK